MGDLGQHFPETSPDFKGINSIILLKHCVDMMRQAGYRLVNLDATVLAQAPKLSPHKVEMERCLAEAFDTDADRINVKATTTEGLGYIGKEEGIAAECVLLIERS